MKPGSSFITLTYCADKVIPNYNVMGPQNPKTPKRIYIYFLM